TRKELSTLKGDAGEVYTVAFCPGDGAELATANKNGVVIVWDTAHGTRLHTLQGHTGDVYTVAFAPDCRRLVSVGGDQTVRIWDTDSARETAVLKGHRNIVYGVAVHP